MAGKRDLRKEIDDMGIFSIEGTGIMTEESVFSAIDAIKKSNEKRDEKAEWAHIKKLQRKRIQQQGSE